MTKLKLPLLSASAWGSFGNILTYARRRHTQYVKKYSSPTDQRSPAQNAQRLRFSVCMLVWNALTSPLRSIWGKYMMTRPWCRTNPFLHTNLNTDYPCRETPNLPGTPYNRKSEWIVGLAKIGRTPIGIKYLWFHGN